MENPLEALVSDGAPRDVAGNSPLPLDGADVWALVSGRLEVFAVLPPRDDAPGSRIRLFGVETGQILFGLGMSGLLAVGGPGCRVAPVSRERFAETARRPDMTAPLARLLDDWVYGLTAVVARGRPPRWAGALEPGDAIRLPDYAAVIPAVDGLWVRHDRGASHFLGRVEQPLTAGDGLLPLAYPGWLAAAEPDTALTATTTPMVLGDAELWKYLDRFHRIILSCVAVNAAASEHVERDRLRRRLEFERRLAHDTLSRLVDVVAPPAEGEDDLETAEGGPAVVEDDPLLAACRLVGARSGIAIRAPVVAGERKKGRDPVRDVARASRVRVRQVRLTPDWHRQDNGPLLGFAGEDERPAALLPKGPTRYELVDPATETRQPVTAAVAASLAPFGWCFYRPFPPGPLTPWGLFRFALRGTRRRDWLSVFLLGLGGSLLGMFTPVAAGWIFGSIIPGAERGQLLLVVLALLGECRVDRPVPVHARRRRPAPGGAHGRFCRGGRLGPAAQPAGALLPALRGRRPGLSRPRRRRNAPGADRRGADRTAHLRLFSRLFRVVVLLRCPIGGIGVRRVRGGPAGGRRVGVGAAALPAGRLSGSRPGRRAGVAAHHRRVAVAAGGSGGPGAGRLGAGFRPAKEARLPARSSANVLAAFNAALPALATAALFALVASLPLRSVSLGAFLAFYVAFVQILASAILMASVVGYAVQVVPLYERTGRSWRRRRRWTRPRRRPAT